MTETVSEWTKERICRGCGRLFRLRDHGGDEAQAVARSLETGSLRPAEAPALAFTCPACLRAEGRRVNEAAAIAAALQIGLEMRGASSRMVYHYAKRIGLFVAALSLGGVVLVQAYARFSRGEFSPVMGTATFALLFAGGVGTFVWAYLNAGKRG
jgi:hypothetical protein